MPLTWFIIFVLVLGTGIYYFPPTGTETTLKRVLYAVLVILIVVGMLQFFKVLEGGPRIITTLK
jgi:hypothetical protein